MLLIEPNELKLDWIQFDPRAKMTFSISSLNDNNHLSSLQISAVSLKPRQGSLSP